MPVFMPCEHGRTKPLQNAKNWPASAYPWSIDTKKSLPSRSPKYIVFPLPPPDQKPLALKARPAVYVIGFHPLHSPDVERHPRQLTLLGVPFSYSFMLCCRKPFISIVYKSIIFHFVFQTWNQNFEIIIMGDLIPIIEGPVKFREGKKV